MNGLKDTFLKDRKLVNNNVRVLQVLSTLGVGGAEKRTIELNRAISSNIIFDYLVLNEDDHQYFEKDITGLGGVINKIPSPRKSGMLKHIFQLNKFFKTHPYKIVHSHTSYHSGIVLFIAYLNGAKIRISHARTNSTMRIKGINRLNLMVGRLLIRLFANLKLAISLDAAKFLYGKLSGYKIIPNGINLKPFYELTNESRLHLRNGLNIKEDDIVYGHVGRFEHMKNHTFLLQIFKIIHDAQPNSLLILVGDGHLRIKTEAMAERMGLSKCIFFVGIQNCVAEFLNAFDVFIFPSTYEGLGGAVIEAQTAGLPCLVSTNVPKETAITDLVQYLKLHDNAEEWAKAAIKACINRDGKYRISEVVQKGYDVNSTVMAYENLYIGLNK